MEIFVAKSGYAMVMGNLTEVVIQKVVLKADGKLVYTTDKGEFVDLKTYGGREEFEKGQLTGEVKKVFDKKMSTYWRMGDNGPEEVSMAPEFDMIRYYPKEIIPEGCYETREMCIKYNTYKKDGEDIDGLVKRMRLTPEQREFLDTELKPVLEKLKDRFIELVFDTENCQFKAFNTARLTDWINDYNEDAIYRANMAELRDIDYALKTGNVTYMNDTDAILEPYDK